MLLKYSEECIAYSKNAESTTKIMRSANLTDKKRAMKTAYNNWVKARIYIYIYVNLLTEIKNTFRVYKKAVKEAKVKKN